MTDPAPPAESRTASASTPDGVCEACRHEIIDGLGCEMCGCDCYVKKEETIIARLTRERDEARKEFADAVRANRQAVDLFRRWLLIAPEAQLGVGDELYDDSTTWASNTDAANRALEGREGT